MDSSFWVMMIFAMLAAGAIRRDQAPVDEAIRTERLRKFRAIAVIFVGVVAIAYAALAAVGSVALLYGMTLGDERGSLHLYLMVPGLAVVSVVLGWIGLLLLRDKDLPGRIARACSAAVEAFFEPIPETAKPKPARHDLD